MICYIQTINQVQKLIEYLEGWQDIEIVFICVQTHNNLETNSVDTQFLESAINEGLSTEYQQLIRLYFLNLQKEENETK